MRFKITAIFLSFCIFISAFSIISFAEGELIGDVNKNGKIDTEDARELLKMAAGIIPVDADTAAMYNNEPITLAIVIDVLTKSASIGGVVIPDKNGDNFLSDDSNNEFIKIIVNAYPNVDPKSLVAIYSIPDSGTNYVLQFKKKIFSDEYVKSPDNLEMVYHIGSAPERKISYTDGSFLEGEKHHHNCTMGEGVLTFNLVKTKVMEQYPNYFVGVKKQ